MQISAERLPTQTQEINQELRISTDTETWLAETLHGSMRTKFEFDFDGQEIRGEDGGSLDEIFDDAIIEARAMTEWNPSLLFELRRRLEERQELNDMYKMASGELPNTMIVISDFPEELKNSSEDVGGYNVSRQQTMMRIIALGDDGKFRITSQSLEGSNRQALESIYAAMGEPVDGGELLSQRIHRDIPAEWQGKLADILTEAYDDSLAEQKGGEWHAGISQHPDRNIVNTYEFVLQQQDLISWFTKEKLADPSGAEKLRYQLAATAKARHERFLKSQNSPEPVLGLVSFASLISAEAIANSHTLTHELEIEGERAARRGDVYSGCGASISADEFSLGGNLSKLGYGGKFKDSDGECEFISKECPQCHEKDVKTKVTKTHITGSCGCSKEK